MADWHDISEFGKIGKQLEFAWSMPTNGICYEGWCLPVSAWNATATDYVIWDWWNFPGTGWTSGNYITFGTNRDTLDGDGIKHHWVVEDGILLYSLPGGTNNVLRLVCNQTNTNWRLYQGVATPGTSYQYHFLPLKVNDGSTRSSSPIYPYGATLDDLADKNYIDGRWEGIVPWPVVFGWRSTWRPCEDGKTAWFPLLKVTEGSGSLKFMFQCDFPRYDTSRGYRRLSDTFNAQQARSSFAIFNSAGVKKNDLICDSVSLEGGIWVADYTTGWKSTESFEASEGDYLMLGLSWYSSGASSGYWGRLIMNYQKT